jgi:DNA-binding response OmpR family regulator
MPDVPIQVLVVDDEPDLLWALQHSLSDEGYQVLTASDGKAALQVAHRHRPDVVVLDVAMPGMDGMEVCRRLRRDPELASVPILFLTVRSQVDDRVTALDEGGDDYMIKPFDLRELKSRIRALLRRGRLALRSQPAGESATYLLTVGTLTLDLHLRQVRVGDMTMPLTPTEFDLLHFMMLHPAEVFSSQKLLEAVWGYVPGAGGSSVVRWHIGNLRAKIELDPDRPTLIRTIPRHGYVLSIPLTQP